jgi:hypothetical protein
VHEDHLLTYDFLVLIRSVEVRSIDKICLCPQFLSEEVGNVYHPMSRLPKPMQLRVERDQHSQHTINGY